MYALWGGISKEKAGTFEHSDVTRGDRRRVPGTAFLLS
jgi:hypothetical protein